MKIRLTFSILVLAAGCAAPPTARVASSDAQARKEYHVSPQGNDANDGSRTRMLKTISAAALQAQPGDVITVHAGVYRERINPPRGGESDEKRIVYQAAKGEKVAIKGSEVVRGWERVQADTWKATLPSSFFGKFNPYSDLIHGDWFSPKGRQHHTGAVYLNGDWLTEAAKLEEAMKPAGNTPLWFGQVDTNTTTIWAQFKGVNPNEQLVEINVRQAVFYPKKPDINYLTVRGFTLRDAATPWAPPTAEQIGLIGTHWSKGWIIESNVISHSICSGIALGKYGDEWDNRARSAVGYVGTINRALTNGWNKATIGHHIVRDNDISHCEQAGIVGSLGCSFSIVTGNSIHDIHVRRLFSGAEMGGIKFHGAIDVEIRGNHIYRTDRGIWLDWMAQGARVTGNLLHDNGAGGDAMQDLFLEVNHGPILVDNNILLSEHSHWMQSEGIAYAHNLFTGTLNMANSTASIAPDPRLTPYYKPHSTEMVALHGFKWGDVRYYNNLFEYDSKRRKTCGCKSWYCNDKMIKTVGFDLNIYGAKPALPVAADGNVYLKDAPVYAQEKKALAKPEFDLKIKLVEKADGWYLELSADKDWRAERTRKLVTTALLGKAIIPNQAFANPDGSRVKLDTDYFGKKRNKKNPFPGPFELPTGGKQVLKVWPVATPN